MQARKQNIHRGKREHLLNHSMYSNGYSLTQVAFNSTACVVLFGLCKNDAEQMYLPLKQQHVIRWAILFILQIINKNELYIVNTLLL